MASASGLAPKHRAGKPRNGLTQLKISEAKIEEYKECFDIFDVNKDGLVSTQEFGQVLERLGLSLTEKELKRFATKANNRDDGKLTFYDFLKILIRDSEGSDEEKLFQAFKIFDQDRDGFITAKELKSALEKLGEKMTEKDAKDMVQLADINGDGKIDYGEFVVMMLDTAR